MPRYTDPDCFTALAHAAFRAGGPSPELQAAASREIDRRGLRPTLDAVNAQIERGMAGLRKPAQAQDEAAA